MEHYIIVDRIEDDQFYDVAVVHFGQKQDIDHKDPGVILHIPIPKGFNAAWVDTIITYQINKLVEYLKGE